MANYKITSLNSIETVDDAKVLYDRAKAAGADNATLTKIHEHADKLRGYTTDASGTTPITPPAPVNPPKAAAPGGTTTKSTVTNPPPPPVTPTTDQVGLRKAAETQGLQVGFDPTTGLVSINGHAVDTSGLSNVNGSLVGNQQQIDSIINQFVSKPPQETTVPQTDVNGNYIMVDPKTGGEVHIAQDRLNEFLQRGFTVIETSGVPTAPFNAPYGEYQSQYGPVIEKMFQEWMNMPAYQSPYAAQLQNLLGLIQNRKFSYDPTSDQAFQNASKELSRNVMEEMNTRGILNSTITENQVQQEVAKLLPQYEQLAYGRFADEGQQLLSQTNLIMGLDQQAYQQYADKNQRQYQLLNLLNSMDESQFAKYKDARDTAYQQEKDLYQKAIDKITIKQQKVKDAWERVSELGYADNDSSITLGVPVGTLSKEARVAAEKRKQDLEDRAVEYKHDFEVIDKNFQNQVKLENMRNAAAAKRASSGNGSTGSIKTAALSKLGTSAQVAAYRNLMSGFAQNGKSAYENYTFALQHPEMYTDAEQWQYTNLGENLYQRLMEDLSTLAANEKKYVGPQMQSDVNNTVLAEAQAQKNQGNLVEWFDAYESQIIESGISTPTLNSVIKMVEAARKETESKAADEELMNRLNGG